MKRPPIVGLAVSKCVLAACVLAGCTPASASDWPQHRYDAGRTAASPDSLPSDLHVRWIRELPPPRPAFPGEVRLRYDATYEPVAAGKSLFVPSMVTDSLTALDTETGDVRWRFFAGGPVRFAPAVGQGKAYFVSDDGYLYCLSAADGSLLWRFRGLPADRRDRKVMGNGRLISLFPARGGPVLADGVVYFAAGIWLGEGVFVHALDANTGRPVWSNVEGHRIEEANMDHGVAYFAGISPQGHLAVVDGKLIVPCGNQLPAVVDLKTGRIEPYTMGWGGRVGLPKGCAFVAGVGKYLIHGGDLYDLQRPNDERFRKNRGSKDFKRMLYTGGLTRLQIDPSNQKGLGRFRRPVLTPEAMYFDDRGIVAWELSNGRIEERANAPVPPHRQRDEYPDKLRMVFPELWRLDSASGVHIKAGPRLYCGRPGIVEAVDIPGPGEQPKVGWQAPIEGTPQTMLAADGKLFVVTREGRIYALGKEKQAEPPVHALPGVAAAEADDWTRRAGDLIELSGTRNGYALVLGLDSGRLAEELARQSRCHVIVVDADGPRIDDFRRRLQQAGLYGTRVTALVGDPTSYPYPPYFASLITSESPAALGEGLVRKLADRLLYCLRPYGGTACLALSPKDANELVRAVSSNGPEGISVREAGGFVIAKREGPLSGSAGWSHAGANAANTGASQDRFVKASLARLWFDGSFRWNRVPGATVVRVAGGRIFILADKLYAIDVYTGRHFWQADLPAPRPSDEGTAALADAIYLASGRACAVLDPATGAKTREIPMPAEAPGNLSMIRVAGDSLVGVCGNTLVCLNRSDGALRWKHERQARVGHLAVGGARVFCSDFAQKPRNAEIPEVAIEALDAGTGEVLWRAQGGSQIRFCEHYDLVCTPRGVLQGSDGKRLRDDRVALVADDKLICGAADEVVVREAKTGQPIGEPIKWFRRGCTSLRASSHLLTTRFMGNAAYVDLATHRITSIWNVRAACSNNLFVADGVLNVPNLSGGCTCNYLPVSQALVPLGAVERLAGPAPGGDGRP